MAKLLALHPLGQMFAFFCGLFALLVITARKNSSTALHINLGLLCYFMAALGFAIGVIVYTQINKNYETPWINTHELIGVIVMMLFSTGAVTGFLFLKKGRVQTKTLRPHKLANYLSMFCFVIQGIIGLMLMINLQ